MDKRIGVIGNGVLSLSVAARMAARGGRVTYIDLAGSVPKGTDVELQVTGAEEYTAVLEQVTDTFDSVEQADIVAVTVTGSAHASVFEQLVHRVREGQVVAFFPACFGAMRFIEQLGELAQRLTVCEAVSFPCVCEARGPQGLFIQGIKSSLRMAVQPAQRTNETICMLNRYFDLFEPAGSILETSMDNMNMTLHPLPVLLNAARVERDAAGFRHYIDGISPSVGRLMEQLDEERMAVGRALGLELTSAYDQLVQYYGERGLPTMWEYASSPLGPYPDVKGFGLNSRYVQEDIPFLMVPAWVLAGRCGVPTPTMELCIRLAGALTGKDFEQLGYVPAQGK